MKDAFGKELAVGDTVVYGEQSYGPRYLKKAKVFKLTPKGAKVKPAGVVSSSSGEQVLTPNMMLFKKSWLPATG